MSAGWVVRMQGLDRPGTITAITNVFSSRGTSFDSLVTGSAAGAGTAITLTFTASPERARQLVRTLGRLAAVDAVELLAADDPSVTAAGVVMMATGVEFRPPAEAVVVWSGDTTLGQPVLVEGQMQQVAATVIAAREAGALATTLVVLPRQRGREEPAG